MPFTLRSCCRFSVQCTVLMFVLCMISVSPGYAAQEGRPFWTEKSAFVEGEDLYVVGVASKAKTAEERRKQAFEQGEIELMNYAQVTSLAAQGLVIKTQMTYEETNPDGTVTVYRLLRVPASKLVAIQGRLQAQSKLQEQTLKQSRMELEARSRGIQETLSDVSQLQVTLSQKAQKLDEQQRQIEQLLQQLSRQLSATSPSSKGKIAMPTLEALRAVEVQLDEKEKELSAIHQRAMNRIRENEKKACKYVKHGMTKTEVETLLGEVDGGSADHWFYGTKHVLFSGGIVNGTPAYCKFIK